VTARERILARVRDGARRHPPEEHPGPAPAPRAPPALAAEAIEGFARLLVAAGGEVVRLGTAAEARDWLEAFSAAFATAAVGAEVPLPLRPALPSAPPEAAELAVSVARAAVAETGSLLLDSREGRRLQLLAPTHLVWVAEPAVVASLEEALARVRDDHGAGIALHSGPSKSADIGGILIRGVHGPGRLVAGVVPEGVFGAGGAAGFGGG
jgi:L-lactate dehydrogenase complex protein LldG